MAKHISSKPDGRHPASRNGKQSKSEAERKSNGQSRLLSFPGTEPRGSSPAEGSPSALGVARGSDPLRLGEKANRFTWAVEAGATENYRLLGQALAATGNLYRNRSDGLGLIQVLPSGKTRLIAAAAQFAPLLADRIPMQVTRDGKVVSELPTATHLNAMLRSDTFLGEFCPVDEVAQTPFYLDDLSLVEPGYNDCGPDRRILYLGSEPTFGQSTETIRRFLDVMSFASNADGTNAVGAGLTMPFRRHWPGEKPLILITASKSHAGKGTLTEFFRGTVPKLDILYEALDWPMQVQFQKQVQMDQDLGLVVFDNVRLDSSGPRAKCIRSAFLESFLTNAEVTLASPAAGEPVRLTNKYVVTLNTNDGALSPDLLNRSLPIHLAPVGDIQSRVSPIGNPKLEFLPANRERIEAEFRGMIERWKVAGCPLDESVRHPMSRWAKTIGGILMVNGFADFLANYGARKTAADPIREALAILGAARPNERLRPMEWAEAAVEQGLAKTLFPPNERDTPKGRERAIGVLLKRNLESTLDAQSETTRYRLRLEGGFRRWKSGNPYTCYVFTILDQNVIPGEEEGGAQ